jgi:hypothetical protein
MRHTVLLNTRLVGGSFQKTEEVLTSAMASKQEVLSCGEVVTCIFIKCAGKPQPQRNPETAKRLGE